MKNDTDFLYGSFLNKYFNFAVNSDPFLICMSEHDQNAKSKNAKSIIPIEEEIQESIKNCQFIMLDDLIFFEMQNKQNKTHSTAKDNIDFYSPDRTPNKSNIY